jgi:nitrite reductase/ring-hydroxylating ferredoxin subunit
MAEIKLCSVDDVEIEQPFMVSVEGREPFAVYNVEGIIYVSDNFCTHGRASLGEEGELVGFNITCSWHDGAFDIRTGEPTAHPCTEPLKVYPVIVRDDDVYIVVD